MYSICHEYLWVSESYTVSLIDFLCVIVRARMDKSRKWMEKGKKAEGYFFQGPERDSHKFELPPK